MLVWLTIAFLQIGSTVAAVAAAPGPCENGTVYDSNAASCSNTKSDAFCAAVFPGTVLNNGPSANTRDPGCLTKDPSLTLACAKQCGLCCELPEYNCDNPKVNAWNCNVITQEECKNVTFRQSIAEWCPNVCGFCIDNGCIDIAPDCYTQTPKICFDIEVHDIAAQMCRKSCDLCHTPLPTTTGPTTSKPANGQPATTGKVVVPPVNAECKDKDPKCSTYKDYCTDPRYLSNPDGQYAPKQMCAKTCGFCH